MARKRSFPARKLHPDPIYGEVIVSKFINALMRDGKRSVAERVAYDSFEQVKEQLKEDPLKVFKKAVENVKPSVEVKSRRVGGANYQVPVEVRPSRRYSLSCRWIIDAARARGGKSMKDKLAAELMDAYQLRGGAIKKREDVHRMAEANKAFSHFRF